MLFGKRPGNGLAGAIVALVLSGCSTLHIDGASQNQINAMRCQQGFGVVNLSIPNSDQNPLLVRTKGMGMSLSRTRLNIGWLDEQKLLMADQGRCQVVIFAEAETAVSQIIENLQRKNISLNNICVYGGKSHEKDEKPGGARGRPADGV